MRVEDMIFISVDDHLVEPPGLFEGRLPARFADRAPRVERTPNGDDVWVFDGSSWTRGPDFPATMVNERRERTRMAWDPKIKAVELFGGVGPGWISETRPFTP